jgi:hypothetical protein
MLVAIQMDQCANKGGWRKKLAYWVLGGLILLNIGSLVIRATEFSQSNALETVQHVFQDSIPHDYVVLADETVCGAIEKTTPKCYPINSYLSGDKLQTLRPDVIVTYTSKTQHLPDSPILSQYLGCGQIIEHIVGWKEQVDVIEIQYDSNCISQ